MTSKPDGIYTYIYSTIPTTEKLKLKRNSELTGYFAADMCK